MKNDSHPKRRLDYTRDERRVHREVYHLLWIPKRRKPVLTGPMARDCQALLQRTCDEKGREPLALMVQPDPVRLCVRVWPTGSAMEAVKACQGLTAHKLRQECPAVLKKLPLLGFDHRERIGGDD